MLLASVYALARLLVAILLLRAQAEAERDLDRLLLAAHGRRLPVGRVLFTPATVLRWHRKWSATAGLLSDVDPVVVGRRSQRRCAA